MAEAAEDPAAPAPEGGAASTEGKGGDLQDAWEQVGCASAAATLAGGKPPALVPCFPPPPPPPPLTPTQPAAATGSTDECVVLRFEVANRREARALQLSSWALTVAISAAAVALVILRNESGEAEEGPCLRVAQSRPRCCCSSVLGTQRLAAHPRTTRFGTRRNLAWAQRAYC